MGRPVFHAEVNIVDKNGRSVKSGDIGEIVVRGSIMMKEYWQDPVRTEEAIRDGRLYTGDLARMAKFKCPKQVVFCEDFPRTSLGKVRKRELIKNSTS